MHAFMIHATPDPEKTRDEDVAGAAGAYITCWIDYQDTEGAEVLARHYIAESGWIPGELDNVKRPTRKDYADDETLRSYFDEALRLGRCLSFHWYPAADEEIES